MGWVMKNLKGSFCFDIAWLARRLGVVW